MLLRHWPNIKKHQFNGLGLMSICLLRRYDIFGRVSSVIAPLELEGAKLPLCSGSLAPSNSKGRLYTMIYTKSMRVEVWGPVCLHSQVFILARC